MYLVYIRARYDMVSGSSEDRRICKCIYVEDVVWHGSERTVVLCRNIESWISVCSVELCG